MWNLHKLIKLSNYLIVQSQKEKNLIVVVTLSNLSRSRSYLFQIETRLKIDNEITGKRVPLISTSAVNWLKYNFLPESGTTSTLAPSFLRITVAAYYSSGFRSYPDRFTDVTDIAAIRA